MHSCFRTCINILIWMGIASSPCWATTYYLSPTGDDLDAGTSPNMAWRTIEHLNAQPLLAGDSVLLEGEQIFIGELVLEPPVIGSPQKPIVISSYGSGRATIKADTGTAIVIYNCAGFEISELNLLGSGLQTNNGAGIYLSTDTLDPVNFEYLYLHHMDISGFMWGGVRMDFDQAYSTTMGRFVDVRLTHLTLHGNGDAGINIEGRVMPPASVYSHSNIYIAHCYAYQNPGVPGKNWNNTGNGIVVGNADTVLIEYCVAHHNGANNIFPGGGPVGIWLWDTRQGTIQSCESYQNESATLDGGGFDLDGGCVECVIQYCYSHGNEGAGYLIAGYPGANPIRDCTIRFNVSQNDGRDANYGSLNFWCHSSAKVDGVEVYHNTVYSQAPSGSENPLIRIHASNMEGMRFYNNIFYSEGGSPFLLYSPVGQEATLFSHNGYYATGATVFKQEGQTYTSVGAWRAATGHETEQGQSTALALDPMLNGVGQGPTFNHPLSQHNMPFYRLDPQSPMIGAGANLAAKGIDTGSRDFHNQSLDPQIFQTIGSSYQNSPLSLSTLVLTVEPKDFGFAFGVDHAPGDWHRAGWKVEVQTPTDTDPTTWSIPVDGEGLRATQWRQRVNQPGTYALRLIQSGPDGRRHRSSWVRVHWSAPDAPQVYWAEERYLALSSLPTAEPVEVELLDLQGRVHHRGQLQNDRVEVPALPRGLYLLRVYTPERTYTLRVPTQ